MDKCVFTVATGKKYLNFAFALARSYSLHNHVSNIPFVIISDADFDLPHDLKWVVKSILSPHLIGNGLEYRFNFYDILPADSNVFIDADSIVYKSLASIFDISNPSIKIIGRIITHNPWGAIWEHLPEYYMEKFDIPYVIHYPGAFYYLNKTKETALICETARALIKSGFPFQQHIYSFNDEPILSISMVKNGVTPISNEGDIYADISQLETPDNLNVLLGLSHFRNVPETHFKDYLPEGNYSPMIVHMGGARYNKNPWIFDAVRLKLYSKYHLGKWLSDKLVYLFVYLPYFFLKNVSKAFR